MINQNRPAAHGRVAEFDGAGHCVREQDKTALLFCGNRQFHGWNYSEDTLVSINGSGTMFEVIIGAGVLFLSALILYKPFVELCKTFIRAKHFSRIEIDQGKNTDEQAKSDFLTLIRMANERIEIFDDGDDMPESVYQDSSIVSAIRKKLLDIQDFEVECYFNDDNDLLFRRELRNEDRVRIRAGIDHDRPVEETHYKIVDNGKIAYLSRHGHKESERNYRRVDCSALTGKAFDETAQALFGKYRNGVQEKVSGMTGEPS